jgi:hypothetical protein
MIYQTFLIYFLISLLYVCDLCNVNRYHHLESTYQNFPLWDGIHSIRGTFIGFPFLDYNQD